MMFRTYAQLVRLPNVFTAFADICLGALVVGTVFPARWTSFLFLLLSSGCLYCSGMVWNDFFDVQQDLKERPFRPIPSGRVSRRCACLIGSLLSTLGLLNAAAAGWTSEGWSSLSLLIAGLIVLMIFAYDGILKQTWLGPQAMGTCRFLNVLLGISAAGRLPGWCVHLALVVGIYVAGVTWFARREARTSSRLSLLGAGGVMLFACALGLLTPMYFPPGSASILFPYLLMLLAFVLGLRLLTAIESPAPAHVQSAVKLAIMGLVALDAILATGIVGTFGLVILLLLVPTAYLGRWIYST
jgi:4-hydroxybenzoate polyprenyltransferase